MTESVTPPDAPLVDPETGETPPLSPQRLDHLVFVVDPVLRRAYIEGSWDVGMESDDAP
jgi:hypothetical protein